MQQLFEYEETHPFDVEKDDYAEVIERLGSDDAFCEYHHDKVDAFLRHLLDPAQSAKLSFEGHGVKPLSSKIVGLEQYKMTDLMYFCAGREWHAIQEVAQRLSLMTKTTDQQYNSVMEAYGFSAGQKFDYYAGTVHLSNVMREMRLTRKQYLESHSADFQVEGKTLDLQAPGENKAFSKIQREITLLAVPPRLPYEHAENILVNAPEYMPLPELNPEWQEFVDKMRTADHLAISSDHVKLEPPQPLNYQTHRLNHPEYGKYGVFTFDLKEEFKGDVQPVIEQVPHTYSTVLAPHYPAFMPRWNRRSANTNLYGAAGRLGRLPVKPELIDYETMDPYLDEAGVYLIGVLERAGLLGSADDPRPSLAWRWLASTKFPGAKKFKYAQAFVAVEKDEDHFIPAEYFSNVHKAFPKNELYAGMDKAQRQILAGDLQMAAVLGPMCDEIGNYFFSQNFTSKKIPERLRPKEAIRRFGLNRVILNDMSAYEGSINPHIKEKCEHRIFKHFYPRYGPWIDRCLEDIECYVQGAHFTIPNCRCSGDPQTSLGNSITNFMSICAAYAYACHETQTTMTLFDGTVVPWALTEDSCPVCWVEGDDSLVKMDANFDKPGFLEAYTQAFIKMGFSTKMEVKDFCGDAGYCSMFFNDSGHNCPSLGQTILDFPWCHNPNNRRGVEYLALKALSLANSAPGQPISWAIAAYFSPRTTLTAECDYNSYEYEEFEREGFDVRINGSKMQVRMRETSSRVVLPTEADRLFFEGRYLISQQEQQKIEQMILRDGLDAFNTEFGSFILRQICGTEGLDLASYEKFYSDNIDTEVMPEEEKLFVGRKTYHVENGKLIETLHVQKNVPVEHIYSTDATYRRKGYIEELVKDHNIIEKRGRILHKLLKQRPPSDPDHALARDLEFKYGEPVALPWYRRLLKFLHNAMASMNILGFISMICLIMMLRNIKCYKLMVMSMSIVGYSIVCQWRSWRTKLRHQQ